eukprot:13354423-Alexandrium_andersonii.AAC.1
MGSPPALAVAYGDYRSPLVHHLALPAGLGRAFKKNRGIPRGCVYSTTLLAAPHSPWLALRCRALVFGRRPAGLCGRS